MDQSKKTLFANTFFLYIMTFSSQLINLVTIPYQTRVLGPVLYGKISVAVSLMMYVQLIMDFGFLLSATEKAASNRKNTGYLCQLFTAVTAAKLVLGILVFFGLLLLTELSDVFRSDRTLYLLYFAAYFVNAFLPDFIYRGMEQMRSITLRTVVIKIIFASLMLLFVKREEDYLRLPVLLFIGNLAAVLFSFWHIKKQFGIRLSRLKWTVFYKNIVDTFPFFVSRIASTFYQALNTLVLGMRFSGQAAVGYYGSADKLLSLVKTASSPVADSIYPYMVRKKDYTLVKKIILISAPVIGICAVFVFLKAEWISVLLFGPDYAAVGNVLRCLLPAMIVIFPSYLITFPVLVPMGLVKYANLSNVFGAVLQMLMLAALFGLDRIDVYTICISSSISEVSVFLFRLFTVMKFRKRIRGR